MQKIEVTRGNIRSDLFIHVIQRMIDSRLSYAAVQTLKLLTVKITNEQTLLRTEEQLLWEKFTEYKMVDGGPDFRQVIPGKEEEYQKAMQALGDKKFYLKLPRIKQADLQKFDLNLHELLAIEGIIEPGLTLADVEEVEEIIPTPLAVVPPEVQPTSH